MGDKSCFGCTKFHFSVQAPVKEAWPAALERAVWMSVCRLLAEAAAVAAELPPVALATAEAMACAVACAITCETAAVDTEPLPEEPATI